MPFAMVAKTRGGADVLARLEIDMPQAGAGEVLIRHEAVGVNFLDIYIREGAYPWPVEENLILGSEGCGIVEAVGEGVDGIAVGDRVACRTVPMRRTG